MTRRQKMAPADVLFSGSSTRAGPQQAVSGPKHVKVTIYMSPDMVADLDEKRAELRRDGDPVDRGRLVRAAIRVAQQHSADWVEQATKEGA